AAYGLRPEPFYLGLAFVALGLGLSTAAVRETREHARAEGSRLGSARQEGTGWDAPMRTGRVFRLATVTEPALSSATQAGLVNNLNDGLAWGLFPLLFAGAGLDLGDVGVLVALYPAVWGLGQLVTGAASDRWGRKPLIVGGMLVQAGALALIALGDTFAVWAAAVVGLGAGTAMVYPTLLASIGDVAHPAWRARAVGVYRLWRDLGFAVGAVLAGSLADLYGIRAAVVAVAALTAASGVLAAVRMYETHPAGVPSAPTVGP
ncbi:MAG: MFS transporter, partial [Actinomycetes bacterium]